MRGLYDSWQECVKTLRSLSQTCQSARKALIEEQDLWKRALEPNIGHDSWFTEVLRRSGSTGLHPIYYHKTVDTTHRHRFVKMDQLALQGFVSSVRVMGIGNPWGMLRHGHVAKVIIVDLPSPNVSTRKLAEAAEKKRHPKTLPTLPEQRPTVLYLQNCVYYPPFNHKAMTTLNISGPPAISPDNLYYNLDEVYNILRDLSPILQNLAIRHFVRPIKNYAQTDPLNRRFPIPFSRLRRLELQGDITTIQSLVTSIVGGKLVESSFDLVVARKGGNGGIDGIRASLMFFLRRIDFDAGIDVWSLHLSNADICINVWSSINPGRTFSLTFTPGKYTALVDSRTINLRSTSALFKMVVEECVDSLLDHNITITTLVLSIPDATESNSETMNALTPLSKLTMSSPLELLVVVSSFEGFCKFLADERSFDTILFKRLQASLASAELQDMLLTRTSPFYSSFVQTLVSRVLVPRSPIEIIINLPWETPSPELPLQFSEIKQAIDESYTVERNRRDGILVVHPISSPHVVPL